MRDGWLPQRWTILAVALLSCCPAVNAAEPAKTEPVRRVEFSRDILPILSDKCFHCHGPDEQQREAELRLDQQQPWTEDRGGYQVVVAGKPEKSELWRRVVAEDPDERMPPASQTRQLTAEDRVLLRQWIEQGAAWDQHWAFRPIVRPPLPSSSALAVQRSTSALAVQRSTSALPVRGPIDAFLEQRLRQANLTASPEAPAETLIRRVTLDLTGLPPSPAEIDAFLLDDSEDAYERLVDRLLSSPQYGEHMASRWLDAARYADTDGYQNDRIRYMWVWRDWLIQALNEGMPFDQFTVEQLAGDMLPEPTLRQQIATGFCRNHRINSEGGSIPAEWQVEYVVDRVDTLGTVWLGLTLGCARCHDHKYDPVSQREYYQLFAFFNNNAEWGLGPNNGNSPPFIPVPESWPHLDPEEDRLIPPRPYDLVTTQTSVVRPKPGGPRTVMVMQELPQPRPTFLLNRGAYDKPDKSQRLQPQLPAVLGELQAKQASRLELARWLVGSTNPLTARVVVNRDWQHFFGTGLVSSSENFGIQGERPSHPELLDWLAAELRQSGWDTKRLHRLIVRSAAYRRSSRSTEQQRAHDPDNRLLTRGPRRRLPAQVIRDQALAASGLLVYELGGASVKPYMPPGIWRSISNNKYEQDHGGKLYRRSLYTYWRRTIPPPTMLNFNSATRETCSVRQPMTHSPLQALTLMNNVLFVEAARFLGQRMVREGGSELAQQLRYGFRLTTARQPTAAEQELLEATFADALKQYQADGEAARALLSVGEAPRDATIPLDRHAALTTVALLLLNLDETITKP